MTREVKLEKLPTCEQAESSIPAIGSMILEMPRGKITTLDVPGFSTLLVENGDTQSIAMLLYCPNLGHGFVTQLNPDGARKVAASLMRLADMVEPLVTN